MLEAGTEGLCQLLGEKQRTVRGREEESYLRTSLWTKKAATTAATAIVAALAWATATLWYVLSGKLALVPHLFSQPHMLLVTELSLLLQRLARGGRSAC